MLQLSSIASVPPQTQLGSLGHISRAAPIICSVSAATAACITLRYIAKLMSWTLFTLSAADVHTFLTPSFYTDYSSPWFYLIWICEQLATNWLLLDRNERKFIWVLLETLELISLFMIYRLTQQKMNSQ